MQLAKFLIGPGAIVAMFFGIMWGGPVLCMAVTNSACGL
jgi:hypothetical protein